MSTDLYRARHLADGFPNLERLGVEWYSSHQGDAVSNIESVMRCADRIIDLENGPKTVCDVGCGPVPEALIWLRAHGFDAVGIEPIASYVATACNSLGDPKGVLGGSAESLPLPDGSQRLVLLRTVLEHVDSPDKVIAEAFRVLMPGGLLFVYTTNRYRVSPTGQNGEFNTRFYNFFPAVLKECYVFHHLHYKPSLANFTPRPAVHWFSFVDLCKIGRRAGFAQFYSPLDVAGAGSPFLSTSFRRLLVEFFRKHPWARALALLQFGNSIFMWKRSA